MASEQEFMDRFAASVREHFGARRVTREPYLEETERRPDLVLDLDGLVRIYFEGEDTPEETIGAVGQAALYAAHDPIGVPAVVYPSQAADGSFAPESALLQTYMPVVGVDKEGWR